MGHHLVSPVWYTTTHLPKIALLKGGWCIYCMFCPDLPHYVQKFHASRVDKHATEQTLTQDLFWETGRTSGDVPCISGQSAERSQQSSAKWPSVGFAPRVRLRRVPRPRHGATLFLVVPLKLSPRGLHHEKAGDDPCFVHELWVSWNRPRFVGIRPGF